MKKIFQNKTWRHSLILLLLLIGGFTAYKVYRMSEIGQYDYWQLRGEIKSYQFLKDNQGVVVQWDYSQSLKETKEGGEPFYVKDFVSKAGERYIVTQNFRLREPLYKKAKGPSKGEYWYLDVYDTKSKDLTKKTYDIFQMVNDYNKDYIPNNMAESSFFTGVYTDQGKDYLPVILQKKGDTEVKHIIYAMIDLEKGKIVDKTSSGLTGVDLGYPYQEANLTVADLDDKLEKNNMIYLYENLRFLKDFDSGGASLLAKQDPKAYELLKNNGTENIMYLLGDKKDLNYKIQMLTLGFPEGTNLFKDVTIPARNSIDGQEHTVQNEQEFLQYYRPSKDFLEQAREEGREK